MGDTRDQSFDIEEEGVSALDICKRAKHHFQVIVQSLVYWGTGIGK